jgi:hypothetical protein
MIVALLPCDQIFVIDTFPVERQADVLRLGDDLARALD